MPTQVLTTRDGQIIGLDGKVIDIKGVAWCKHTPNLMLASMHLCVHQAMCESWSLEQLDNMGLLAQECMLVCN